MTLATIFAKELLRQTPQFNKECKSATEDPSLCCAWGEEPPNVEYECSMLCCTQSELATEKQGRPNIHSDTLHIIMCKPSSNAQEEMIEHQTRSPRVLLSLAVMLKLLPVGCKETLRR